MGYHSYPFSILVRAAYATFTASELSGSFRCTTTTLRVRPCRPTSDPLSPRMPRSRLFRTGVGTRPSPFATLTQHCDLRSAEDDRRLENLEEVFVEGTPFLSPKILSPCALETPEQGEAPEQGTKQPPSCMMHVALSFPCAPCFWGRCL